MDADLIVIGAGFWGTAMARLARSRGMKVLLVDALRPSASRAASGYFAESWYKDDWTDRGRIGFEDAKHHGLRAQRTGANVSTPKARKNETPIHTRGDLWTFDPRALLAKPDLVATVGAIAPFKVQSLRGGGVYFPDHEAKWAEAPRIYIAAGIWTDEVLKTAGLAPMGVTASWGAAAILKHYNSDVFAQPFIYEQTPFRHISVRKWGEHVRVCATVAGSEKKAREGVARMVETVAGVVESNEIVEVLCGPRPVLPDGPIVRVVAPGVVAATGGGRIGAALAFWAAEKGLRELG